MATINLEVTRSELINALANTTDIDVIGKMKRAYDRIIKSKTEKQEWPFVGPATYEEMEARLNESMAQVERGETIPLNTFFNSLRQEFQG